MSNSDVSNIFSTRESLFKKQLGTGSADTSTWEWYTNIHRDTYASCVGNYAQLLYYSTIFGQSVFESRNEFIAKMMLPVGLRPGGDVEENVMED